MKTECHEEDVQSYRKTVTINREYYYTQVYIVCEYFFFNNTIRTGNLVYDV